MLWKNVISSLKPLLLKAWHTMAIAVLEADPRLALLGTAEGIAAQVPTAPADDTAGAVVQTGLSGGVAKKKKVTAKATPTKKDE